MNRPISDVLLSELSKFVALQMGLHFPKERWRDLERGICSATREFGFKDSESCIRWLTSSSLTRNQIEILASHLTVGETYFLREKKSFEVLEEHIFPELVRSRQNTEKRLRIWSAGCATGEEPYSIAILLNKMIPALKDWNITILATDINPRFLQKASAGVYSEWSFRDTPILIKERYFKRTKEGSFEILPSIRELVSFSYLNLAEDSYPALLNNTNAMDIIFCRNVLMYFAQERQRQVIQKLYRCLVDGGWLIVSPSEISHVLFAQFTTVNFQGATFYKKQLTGVRDYVEVIDQQLEIKIQESKFMKQFEPIPETELQKPDIRQPAIDPYMDALTLFGQGRYAEAAEKIALLLSLKQDDATAMALLARVHANQGKLSEALEWCEKAIASDKLNPGSHYLLATILQERGRFEEAAISLKRVLYLDQNFVLAHFALGNLTRLQGKLRESEKHFHNALSLLSAYRQENILPESEGITAGRMTEIINSIKLQDTVCRMHEASV